VPIEDLPVAEFAFPGPLRDQLVAAAGWRAAHERFWHSPEIRAELGDPGFTVNDETLVVAETFRLTEDAT
jgi:hypothetical protein